MKKIFIFAFFLLYFSSFLIAQNSCIIRGTVRDSSNKESIPFAIIQIRSTKFGTSADVNGFYSLNNIPTGEYILSVNAVGYNPFTKNIKIDKETTILLNIFLKPQLIKMNEVTRTVDRLKEIYKTNISVQALGQEEISMIPVPVQKDLFRAIKIVPGISSTGDVTSQFYVRGGGGDQNLILYDNMMIYNPFHAFGLFSIFNLDAIKISEVFTGGIEPEYGGRLSSVINIITKDGNKNKYAGNLNLGLLSGQGVFEGPISDGSFFITYRKSIFNTILKDFLSKNIPLSFYDFSGKITYPLSDEGKITFNSLLSNDQILNTDLSDPNYYWKNYSFGLDILSFWESSIINVSMSSSNFQAEVDNKLFQGEQGQKSNVSDFFFDAKIHIPIYKNDRLHFGFGFIFPHMEFSLLNNAKYFVKKTFDYKEMNMWSRYEFTQLENLILNLGVRMNFDNMDDPAYLYEPRFGFKFQILPDLSFKGSFSRYHQGMFTSFNEDDIIPIFEMWMPVKQNRKSSHPERNDEAIVGFDFSPFEYLDCTIQGYNRNYSNLMSYNLNKKSATDPDYSSNGIGISYGIEYSMKLRIESIYALINYTWNWAEKTVDGVTFFPKYDKRHSFKLLFGMKLPFEIDANAYCEISSGTPFTPITSIYDRYRFNNLGDSRFFQDNPEIFTEMGNKNSKRLPAYSRVDLSFSRNFNIGDSFKLKANLDLVNLLNVKNILYFDRFTGKSIFMLPFLPTFSLGVEL